MKRYPALLVLVLLWLSGCTMMQPLPRDLPEQVRIWTAEQEYGKALSMLDKVRTNHPRYIELIRLKPDVEAQADAFARRISREAETAWRADDWHSAYEKLQYGLTRYPQSKHLHETLGEYQTARQAYLEQLQRQLDLNTAPYLAENLQLHRKLVRAAPDHSEIVQRTERKEAEANALYARLLNCGGEAKKEQRWQLARQCYALADQLKPSPALARTLDELDDRLRRQERRTAEVIRPQSRHWLETARSELDKDNVKEALQAYEHIDKSDREHASVVHFKQQLDARIEQNIQEGIDVGRKFYTQGKVERALAIWHALKKLDPRHEELNAHIARAEKVLNKIKSLRKDEGVLPPDHGNNNS